MEKHISDKILDDAREHVFNIMNGKPFTDLFYHSINHTKNVLRNVEVIGNYFGLNHEDLNILKMSALFHDLGFLDICDGHEEKSVEYAEKYLREEGLDESIISKIANAIMATKVPQSPNDLLSKILCDADLMNLSSEEKYMDDIERLREEWIFCGKEQYSKEEFYKISLDFLKSHHFHTEYGLKILKPKKEKTEKLLIQKMNNN